MNLLRGSANKNFNFPFKKDMIEFRRLDRPEDHQRWIGRPNEEFPMIRKRFYNVSVIHRVMKKLPVK